MATSGEGGFFEEKKSLVMRGADLVLVDGMLVLGPCDRAGSYAFPLTEGVFPVYGGHVYMKNEPILKNVNIEGSAINVFSLTGDRDTYRNIIEIGTVTDGFGGVVYAIFNQKQPLGQNYSVYLSPPQMFVVGACSWKVTWPSYNVSKYEITRVFGVSELTNYDLMNEYFGPTLLDGTIEGDCRTYIRRYATLAGYNGPTVNFEVRTFRPGRMKIDSEGHITDFI